MRSVLFSFLLAAGAFPAFGIDIHIAPIVFLDESASPGKDAPKVEADLFDHLSTRSFEGKAVFKRIEAGKLPAPRSLIEALGFADANGYPFLMYGYLRRTDDALFAEIRMADRDARTIAAVFYSVDTVDRYDRLVEDLGRKVYEHLAILLGIGTDPSTLKTYRYVWSIPIEGGYWAPASGDWADAVSGLAYAKLGLRFWPRVPSYIKNSHPRHIGAGFDAEYAYGTNAPGRESAELHSGIGRLAFDFLTDFENRHRVGLSLGPFIRMDYLRQTRLYDEEVLERTSSPGFGVEFIYAALVGRPLELGATLSVDATFYDVPLVTVSPRLRIAYRFLPWKD